MDITRREILRAFSVDEATIIKLLNRITISKQDVALIDFINVINKATYKSLTIAQIMSNKII